MYQASPPRTTAPGPAQARPPQNGQVELIAKCCQNCRRCTAECDFLAEAGTPGDIAHTAQEPGESEYVHHIYRCSQCGLCSEVCPVGLNPAAMILELRRQAVQQKIAPINRYRTVLAYEHLGRSFPFRLHHLPPGCTSVFFPGCALPGLRPRQVEQLYLSLQSSDPNIGISLDCCSKISRDLGRETLFSKRLDKLVNIYRSRGIKEIITACPSCHMALRDSGLDVTFIYSRLEKQADQLPYLADSGYAFHDPCSFRNEQATHRLVRDLARQCGINHVEMEHSRETTLCCGAGGAAGCIDKEIPKNWSRKRCTEAADKTIITYCAGCTETLSQTGEVQHLVDILYPDSGPDPVRAIPFKKYFNRLKLKLRILQLVSKR